MLTNSRLRLAVATTVLLGTLGSGTALVAAQKRQSDVEVVRTALKDGSGRDIATVELRKSPRSAVKVLVTGRNLPPGFHGFHVHAVGSCDATTAAPFTSAGGHLNPGSHDHAEHAGDMPVLYVLADGTASLGFLTDRYSVAELFDGDGSALIVHALPDNYANIPSRYAAAPDAMTLATGDAGGRLACAVMQ